MTSTTRNLPEEDSGEEKFYESLDRILSSCSNSGSVSASDDESYTGGHRRRVGRLRLPPLRSLDVWFSEPASVEERRRRLLRHLGLSGDPALSRPRRSDAASCKISSPSSSSGVAWPGCDGSASKSLCQQRQVPSKPPLGVRFRIPDASKGILPIEGGVVPSDSRFVIKNLDDGREFVVKELQEDRMSNTVREVGTGRQLTMEEFDMCIGKSPIVQELMKRQSVEDATDSSGGDSRSSGSGGSVVVRRSAGGWRWKKRGSWLRSIKNVAENMVARGHNCDRKRGDDKDSSSEMGGRSSSATNDNLDGLNGLNHCPERIRVRQYGKSQKELSGLCMTQEIQAHNGSIWSIRFSLDGQYLASGGEDCAIRVWEVLEVDRFGNLANDVASPEMTSTLASADRNQWDKQRRAKVRCSKKSVCSHPLKVPAHIVALSEKPVCCFRGHLGDVLDLSWSTSQFLLSSSMDKTVRLWHMSSTSCLKVFSHSTYVTCIQFNPVDDRYFISGSLDNKVRIWSIPDRQVIDWKDLHEMVTAACYTPDGQGALIGTHRGNCHLYDASDSKLIQKSQVDLKNRKKKITGFQFAPGNPSKVLVTSADSQIRIIDGDELVHKLKGFRNTNSQISAFPTADGKHVISASEDSHIYVWRFDDSQTKGDATTTQSYEYFHCRGVTVAAPWPNTSLQKMARTCPNNQANVASVGESDRLRLSDPQFCQRINSHQNGATGNSNWFNDKVTATWPEELMTPNKQSPKCNGDLCNGGTAAQSWEAFGLVIVTAGVGGEIKTYQNFDFPIHL
ncbi:WD repeat-containing protein 44-like isoform X1 [Zingiber officinale]|uniref:WD repeat-containing protein 44-like isoform X1 n=1 Tax=Zingiber officinale TaxID=94328 RepID=UPI001C4DCBDF|nr:WD repeat-containing protein 44-like isoform X1 [Zingiber officinale]